MPVLVLPDQRRLGYEIIGPPDGYPMLYCHGFPTSRLEARMFRSHAFAAGVQLVAADRPGFGESDFQPGRRLPDWAEDLARLCDHLEIDRCPVLGVSGGAPYAVSASLVLTSRIERLGIVCGLGPLAERDATVGMGGTARMLIGLCRDFPTLALPIYRWLVAPVIRRNPASFMSTLNADAPTADRDTLREPELQQTLVAAVRDAFRRGGRGPAWDLHVYTQPWPLDPSDVAVSTYLWHGEADNIVPVAMGRRYAALISGCQAMFLPDHGHHSLLTTPMEDILETMRRG